MIALHYLRDYYEATGDERVPPFFEEYFRFQLDTLPEHPLQTTVAETMPAQPFRAADAPVRLQLKAVKTDLGDWGKCREDFPARAVELPRSPVEVTGDVETITLVPYGSTEIRTTQFPWVKK